MDYEASGGREIFLSFDDIKHDKLAALLRLRLCLDSRNLNNEKTAIIRELHTYGEAVPLFRDRDSKHAQHHGLGKRLVKEAEKKAKKKIGAKKKIRGHPRRRRPRILRETRIQVERYLYGEES